MNPSIANPFKKCIWPRLGVIRKSKNVGSEICQSRLSGLALLSRRNQFKRPMIAGLFVVWKIALAYDHVAYAIPLGCLPSHKSKIENTAWVNVVPGFFRIVPIGINQWIWLDPLPDIVPEHRSKTVVSGFGGKYISQSCSHRWQR